MGNEQSYKGFTIRYAIIIDGKNAYAGLVANKKGIKIESPELYKNNYAAICRVIDGFNIA
ncbi:MAG: hypothetical protein LBV72_00465 [Tannerella sp.]|jgi:hypothetical protein|nr:hypothetical protein [Tannerella sp.]